MEAFVCQNTLHVPDPEHRLFAPFLFVANENRLQADVGDTGKTPEHGPGHRLLQVEHVAAITTDATHLSQRTITADEVTHLKGFESFTCQSVSHPLLDFHSVSDFERLDDIVVADIEVDDKKERRKKWPTWSWTWTGG